MHDAMPEHAATPVARLEGAKSWTAQMVRPLTDAGVGAQSSFLRKRFDLAAVGGGEHLFISAFGLYRAFINGTRVGNDLLTPGWTAYDKRLSYQTYDVAALLKPGENVIDIWLADGWYRSQMMWAKQQALYNTWGDRIAAIAELRAGPGDAPLLLATDGSWESGLLPILKSGIYFGEIYDARLEDLHTISGSAVLPFDAGRLVAHETGPVRELTALAPIDSWRDAEGRMIYDFGQNCGAYVAFTVKGDRGAEVIIEHAEILDRKRNIDNSNYRSAIARVDYVLKGEGEESFRPFFTFQGYRYARVTIAGHAEILDIVSVPISSAVTPTGAFTSGNALVNRLVENTIWSQRSNFIEVPTDCPQRDERLGWTGDAQVFAPTACYLHESHSFWVKWLRDVMADQREDGAIAHVVPDPTRMRPEAYPGFFGSTGWGDAITIVPWTLYEHYGDTAILAETLPAMVRWVDFVWSISDGPIVTPPRPWGSRGFTFGDWLQPKGPSEKPLPTIGDDAAATIYLCISARLTARVARIVGDATIAARMEAMADKVKAAFAREFIAPSGRLVYDDQTSYALAILHDLVPAGQLDDAARYFKATIARANGRIGTGFIGTPALLPALVKIGAADLAAEVFLQEGVPGWLYQVKSGATTIWERWDAIGADGTPFDPAMNSYNHYAYGAVCQFLFEQVAGFRPDPERPGFRHILFEPLVVPAMAPVAAHHDALSGRIEAGWTIEDGLVRYRFTVPDGTEATLLLRPGYHDIAVDGRALAATPGQTTRVPVGPGAHEATFRIA